MNVDLQATQFFGDIGDSDEATQQNVFISFDLAPEDLHMVRLFPGVVVIGRDPSCSVPINASSLSRRHAAIKMDENGMCFVTDLKSLNGTWRNELRLKPNVAYELRSMDRIKLGTVTAVFRVELTQRAQSLYDSPVPVRQVSMQTSPDNPSDQLPAAAPPISMADSELDRSNASSTASSHLLAPVVIDTEVVTNDLLPNGSQYVSRSPSPVIWSTDRQLAEGAHSAGSPLSLLTDMFICDTQPETAGDDDAHLAVNSFHQVIIESESTASAHTSSCSRNVFNAGSHLSKPLFSNNSTSCSSPRIANRIAAVASTPFTSDRQSVAFPLAFDSEPRTGSSISHSLNVSKSGLTCSEADRVMLNTHSAVLIEESQAESLPSDRNTSLAALSLSVHEGSLRSPGISSVSLKPSMISKSQIGPVDDFHAERQDSHELSVDNGNENGSDATQPMTFDKSIIAIDNTEPLPSPISVRPIPEIGTCENTELTQPMVQPASTSVKRLSGHARPNAVDLDASPSSVNTGHKLQNKNNPPAGNSAAFDDLTAASLFTSEITPLSRRICQNHALSLQTTTRLRRTRAPKQNRRVSELFLSDEIGLVKFRSRGRRSLGNLDQNTSDDSQVELRDIGQLTGTPISLIKRASQRLKPSSDQTENPSHHNHVRSKKGKSFKPNLLRIPSPVQFPDSILSEDPSQLEDSMSRSASTNVRTDADNVELHGDPSSVSPADPRPATVPPSIVDVTFEHGSDETSRKSAIRSAGFDESPISFEQEHVSRIPCPTPMDPTTRPSGSLSFSDLELKSGQLDSRNSINQLISEISPFVLLDKTAHPQDTSQSFLAHIHDNLTGTSKPGRNTGRVKSGIRTRHSVMSKASIPEPTYRSRRLTTRMNIQSSELDQLSPSLKRSCSAVRSSNPASKKSRHSLKYAASDISRVELIIPFSLLFSGIDPGQYSAIISSLGASETEDVTKASYLITDGWKRTLKMLYARARGIPIISVDWLLACKRTRKPPYPEPSKFLLAPSSTKRSSRRSTTLTHSTPSDGEQTNYLKGWYLRSTSEVMPPPKHMAQLCRFAGGCWMSDDQLKHALTEQPVRVVIITTSERLRSISNRTKNSRFSAKNSRLWEAALSDLPCVSVEWFLQTIMQRVPPKWPVANTFRLN